MNHLSFLKYCKTKFFAEKIASAFKGPLTKLRFEEFILLRSFRSILYESKAHKFCPKYLNCFLGLQTLKNFSYRLSDHNRSGRPSLVTKFAFSPSKLKYSSLALYSLYLHLPNSYFSSVFITISVQVFGVTAFIR